MRILAVLDNKRSRFYPDAKTAEEQGYPVFSGVHQGVALPAGAPREARDVLVKALKQVITSNEFAKQLEKTALDPLYMDAQEYSAFWSEFESGIVKWIDVCKKDK